MTQNRDKVPSTCVIVGRKVGGSCVLEQRQYRASAKGTSEIVS
jgi:hypothetical protein